MDNNFEKGIGLIFALIVAAVISLCLVTIIKCLQRGFLGISFANSAHQAQAQITENLIQDLNRIEELPVEQYFNALSLDPAAEVHLLGSENKTFALISRTLTKSNFRKKKSLFLVVKNASSSSASQLDWDYAADAVASAPTACTNWVNETKFNRSAVNPRSINTCTQVNNIGNSILFWGNVSSNHQLAIENISDKTIYVLITGYLKLTNALVLNNLDRAKIFLIAAGEIEIANISLSNVHNSSLLIYSSAGWVDIAFTEPLISLCNPPTNTPLQLSVEGFKNVGINGKDYGANLGFGCPVIRDSNFWPKFRVLGRP